MKIIENQENPRALTNVWTGRENRNARPSRVTKDANGDSSNTGRKRKKNPDRGVDVPAGIVVIVEAYVPTNGPAVTWSVSYN